MKKALKLFPSNSNFSVLFDKEKNRIEKALGSKVTIEHIGSTAVPGLGGKGIIDILIGVMSDKDINSSVDRLVEGGYYLDLDNPIDLDRVFLASREHDSRLGDYHLHVVLKDGRQWKDIIYFRDLLRTDDSVRHEYSSLKKSLFASTEADRLKYKKQKGEFIENILKLRKKNMAEYQKNTLKIFIESDPKKVFEYTLDTRNTPKYFDSIEEEISSDIPAKLGTVLRNRAPNSDKWFEVKITEFVKDNTFTLSEIDGDYRVKYSFVPKDGGTEFSYCEWIENGVLKDRTDYSVLEKLKKEIESR